MLIIARTIFCNASSLFLQYLFRSFYRNKNLLCKKIENIVVTQVCLINGHEHRNFIPFLSLYEQAIEHQPTARVQPTSVIPFLCSFPCAFLLKFRTCSQAEQARSLHSHSNYAKVSKTLVPVAFLGILLPFRSRRLGATALPR